jgi:putative transposase
MPRTARIVIPGVAHHVVQRGNRKQKVFFRDDHYRLYLKVLAEHCILHHITIHTYCLMSNHVHFVMVPSDSRSLALCMKHTHQKYTRIINQENNWTGCLWQGRFFSRPMDEVYTLYAARYIERNPVEAGLVRKSQWYPWSGAYEKQPYFMQRVLHQAPLYDAFDSWRNFVNNGPTKEVYDERIRIQNNQNPLGNIHHLGTDT